MVIYTVSSQCNPSRLPTIDWELLISYKTL